MSTTWLNGKLSNQLDLPSRGLAYGDGLFETIRIDNGNIPMLQSHIDRLTNSCLDLKIISEKKAIDEALVMLQSAINYLGTRTGILKLILLRKFKARGYRFTAGQGYDVVIEFYPCLSNSFGWHMEAIQLGVCSSPVSINQTLAGHKHLNRLDSVMASHELIQNGWDDGVMLCEDQVIETTSANIFLIKDNSLSTPLLNLAGVSGVSRSLVLTKGQEIFDKVEQRHIGLSEMFESDFIFITNAVMIARAVHSLKYSDTEKVFEHSHPKFKQLTSLLSGVFN